MSENQQNITIKIRSSKGNAILKMKMDSSLEELRKEIEKQTQIKPNRQKLSTSFPVRDVPLFQHKTLKEVDIRNGDTFNVEETNQDLQFQDEAIAEFKTLPLSSDKIMKPPHVDKEGFVFRRVVPADNSCLFASFGYIFEQNRNCWPKLRRLVAEEIVNNPDKYDAAFLEGKQPSEYAAWILNYTSWGGSIEVSILSRHYQSEVSVFDIRNVRYDTFGQDLGFKRRVLLL